MDLATRELLSGREVLEVFIVGEYKYDWQSLG